MSRFAEGRRRRAGAIPGVSWSELLFAIVLLASLPAGADTPLTGALQVSPGTDHTCVVMNGGAVQCWGKNTSGQLGNGTTVDSLGPITAVGLSSGVLSVAAGSQFTCALTTSGGVKCWGKNAYGQIGDNTAGANRTSPVDVWGLSTGVKALAAGAEHACALTWAGAVKCWGRGAGGALGNGATTDRIVPTDVGNVGGPVEAISAGLGHSCALLASGAAKCWGSNKYGQVGNGTLLDQLWPVDVTGLASGVTALAGGWFHNCALTVSGTPKCWGRNDWGEIGDGTTNDRTTPMDVTGLAGNATVVVGGGAHNCAITKAGTVKCWGANWGGQVGDGGQGNSRTRPVDVAGLSSAVLAIATGEDTSCAIVGGGAVQCWGEGRSTPQPVSYGPFMSVSKTALAFDSQFVGTRSAPQQLSITNTGAQNLNLSSVTVQGEFVGSSCPAVLPPGGNCGVPVTFAPFAAGSHAGAVVINSDAVGSPVQVVLTGTAQMYPVRLPNSVPLTALSGASGSLTYFYIDIPASTSTLTVQASGGTGDVDLYVRRGSLPTTDSYDCRSWFGRPTETCTLANPAVNRHFVALKGTTAYSGVTLTGTYVSPALADLPGSYQGLWWNSPAASESGWGINFAHQGDIIFATWFTYDESSKPIWMIAELRKTMLGVYTGNVSTVTGPPLASIPWDSSKVTETPVGTMTVAFAGLNDATLLYAVNGIGQSKAITRQVFGSVPVCLWGAENDVTKATNYQDLWWNEEEPGWGINLTHQGNSVFATWFTYDIGGKPWWLIAELDRVAPTVFTGPASTVTGPPFNSSPFDSTRVSEAAIGAATVNFLTGATATLDYTIDGVTQSKRIERQVFVPPGTICR